MKTAYRASRRTLVKAGAWSVPVIAVAAAAPQAAASPAAIELTFSNASAKYLETQPEQYAIESVATVTVLAGVWPAEGILLQNRYYNSFGFASSSELMNPTGQTPITFPYTAGASLGFDQFALYVFAQSDSNHPLGSSTPVDITPP